MNEEKIKTLEKKVDLLFRMHLEEDFYLDDNLHEFIPLFDLSIEMEEIKIKGFVAEKLIEDEKKIRSELDKLKSDREAGNFLAKDKDKIAEMIYNYEEKYEALKRIAKSYDGLSNIEDSLRKELLVINLKERLGIKLSEEYGFRQKETLEEKLKEAIDWLQEELKEYKEKFK